MKKLIARHLRSLAARFDPPAPPSWHWQVTTSSNPMPSTTVYWNGAKVG